MFWRSVCLFWSLFACSYAWAIPHAKDEGHLRVGPFFEWRERGGKLSRLAVRPFFAWEREAVGARDRDLEVFWPLSHAGWRGEEYHARFLFMFWQEADRTGQTSRDYSFSVPPLWVHGRDLEKPYWGLFPLYGKVPKLFFLEDVQWAAFPLWLRYRTGGSRAVRRDYFGWPFLSAKYDPDRTRWALWPLFGVKREPDFDARFVLWPFWNDQTFHAPKRSGRAWMLWPLIERIDADSEQGWGVLPPLFRNSSATNGARLWRAPWPLLEHYEDARENTWRGWRLWGIQRRGSRRAWWLAYPIIYGRSQQTPRLRKRSIRLWPFYTDEAVYSVSGTGAETLKSSFFRLWPFYSSTYEAGQGLRRRALELFPIHDVPAVERNWAPFWTLYTATRNPGSDEVLHELFWGLIWWRTRAEASDEARAPEETKGTTP